MLTCAFFFTMSYILEITQLVRQKSNLSCRRGDKRSIKGSVKTKYAPFSVKAGSSSFGSAGGANNFFGMICCREYILLENDLRCLQICTYIHNSLFLFKL